MRWRCQTRVDWQLHCTTSFMIFLCALSTAGMSTTTSGQESSTCWSSTIRRRRRRRKSAVLFLSHAMFWHTCRHRLTELLDNVARDLFNRIRWHERCLSIVSRPKYCSARQENPTSLAWRCRGHQFQLPSCAYSFCKWHISVNCFLFINSYIAFGCVHLLRFLHLGSFVQ